MGYTVTFDRSLEKCIRYRDIDRDSRETENRLKVPISKLFDTKNLFTDNNLDRDSQFLSQIILLYSSIEKRIRYSRYRSFTKTRETERIG